MADGKACKVKNSPFLFLEKKKKSAGGKEKEPLTQKSNILSITMKKEKPDYFLGIAGNGTILYGLGKALKNKYKKIKVIGVETTERPVLYNLKFPGKYEKEYGKKPVSIEEMKGKDFFAPGTGALGIDFPHIRSAANCVDDIILATRNEAEEALKELKEKGFDMGHTSAISYVAAGKIAEKLTNKKILIIFYDKGNRY